MLCTECGNDHPILLETDLIECLVCKESLYYNDLQDHVASYEFYKCVKCDAECLKSDRMSHLSTTHWTLCDLCGDFLKPGESHNHNSDDVKTEPEETSDEDILEKNFKLTYKCKCCKKKIFEAKDDLVSHIQKTHKCQTMPCKKCHSSDMDLDDYYEHMQYVHKVKVIVPELEQTDYLAAEDNDVSSKTGKKARKWKVQPQNPVTQETVICCYCEEGFTDFVELCKHVLLSHSSKKQKSSSLQEVCEMFRLQRCRSTQTGSSEKGISTMTGVVVNIKKELITFNQETQVSEDCIQSEMTKCTALSQTMTKLVRVNKSSCGDKKYTTVSVYNMVDQTEKASLNPHIRTYNTTSAYPLPVKKPDPAAPYTGPVLTPVTKVLAGEPYQPVAPVKSNQHVAPVKSNQHATVAKFHLPATTGTSNQAAVSKDILKVKFNSPSIIKIMPKFMVGEVVSVRSVAQCDCGVQTGMNNLLDCVHEYVKRPYFRAASFVHRGCSVKEAEITTSMKIIQKYEEKYGFSITGSKVSVCEKTGETSNDHTNLSASHAIDGIEVRFCSLCGELFIGILDIEAHLKAHTSYVCKCGYRCSSLSMLEYHVSLKHPRTSPYIDTHSFVSKTLVTDFLKEHGVKLNQISMRRGIINRLSTRKIITVEVLFMAGSTCCLQLSQCLANLKFRAKKQSDLEFFEAVDKSGSRHMLVNGFLKEHDTPEEDLEREVLRSNIARTSNEKAAGHYFKTPKVIFDGVLHKDPPQVYVDVAADKAADESDEDDPDENLSGDHTKTPQNVSVDGKNKAPNIYGDSSAPNVFHPALFNSLKVWTCSKCGIHFPNQAVLEDHLSRSGSCLFNYKATAKKHMPKEKVDYTFKDLTTPACPVEYTIKDVTSDENKPVAKRKSLVQRIYGCNICKIYYMNEESLKDHQDRIHKGRSHKSLWPTSSMTEPDESIIEKAVRIPPNAEVVNSSHSIKNTLKSKLKEKQSLIETSKSVKSNTLAKRIERNINPVVRLERLDIKQEPVIVTSSNPASATLSVSDIKSESESGIKSEFNSESGSPPVNEAEMRSEYKSESSSGIESGSGGTMEVGTMSSKEPLLLNIKKGSNSGEYFLKVKTGVKQTDADVADPSTDIHTKKKKNGRNSKTLDYSLNSETVVSASQESATISGPGIKTESGSESGFVSSPACSDKAEGRSEFKSDSSSGIKSGSGGNTKKRKKNTKEPLVNIMQGSNSGEYFLQLQTGVEQTGIGVAESDTSTDNSASINKPGEKYKALIQNDNSPNCESVVKIEPDTSDVLQEQSSKNKPKKRTRGKGGRSTKQSKKAKSGNETMSLDEASETDMEHVEWKIKTELVDESEDIPESGRPKLIVQMLKPKKKNPTSDTNVNDADEIGSVKIKTEPSDDSYDWSVNETPSTSQCSEGSEETMTSPSKWHMSLDNGESIMVKQEPMSDEDSVSAESSMVYIHESSENIFGDIVQQKQIETEENFKNKSAIRSKCGICNKVFESLPELVRHSKMHSGNKKKFKCTVCPQSFESLTQAKDHKKTHTPKEYVCPICDKVFMRSWHFKEHMVIHSKFPTPEGNKCDICGTEFQEFSSLRRHMHCHYKDVLDNKEPAPGKYKCEKCDMRFNSRKRRAVHFRHEHNGDLMNQCDLCEKSFYSPSELQRHYRTHTGERPFACAECGKAFALSTTLKDHMMSHTGLRPFKCEVCGKAYSSSSILGRHKITHLGIKNHRCKVCGKEFSYANSLRIHMRTHTNERPYVCKICNKSFTMSSHYSSHMRIHTGEKPYHCMYCDYKCGNYGSHYRHIRNHDEWKIENGMMGEGDKGKKRTGRSVGKPIVHYEGTGEDNAEDGNVKDEDDYDDDDDEGLRALKIVIKEEPE